MSNPPQSPFIRVTIIATIVCWLPLLITPAIIMLGSFKPIPSGPIAFAFVGVIAGTWLLILIACLTYSPLNTENRSLRAYVWHSLKIQLAANITAILSQAIGMIFSAAGLVDWFSLSASAIGFGCICAVAAIIALAAFVVSKSRTITNFITV